MPTLEQRLQRLEDLEQITEITMQLARHFDNNYHADGVVSLFTDDGVFDGALAHHQPAARLAIPHPLPLRVGEDADGDVTDPSTRGRAAPVGATSLADTAPFACISQPRRNHPHQGY